MARPRDDRPQPVSMMAAVGGVRRPMRPPGTTMEAPDVSSPSGDDPYKTFGDAPPAAPGVAGRFRILRPHARGNLGEVFVAHDGELHREVALKEIQPARAHDPDSRRRFLVEAEVTGALEHPGIVPVYSLGTHADGRPYYAMRFIRGSSLLEAIEELHEGERTGTGGDESSLALRRLLRSVVVASQAIDYAHSRGVIHRDVKPHNIMLGRHGETIVVDWGLAKVEGTHVDDAPTASSGEWTLPAMEQQASDLTAAGSLIGTPAYMSPEQASGRHDLVGPPSDIYSLGATLYHLLAGRVPFRGESVAEVLHNVVAGRHPPLHAVRPGVSRALESIVSKAMATDPAARYGTAAAFADDIEHWLADQPFATYQERPSERLFRWLRRHRSWAIAGIAAIAATALISLVAVRVVDKQRRIARQFAIEKALLAESEGASREQAVAGIYRARAGELAAASRAIRPVKPDLGVLLAVESIEMTTRQGLPIVAAAEEALREAISQVGGIPFQAREAVLHMSDAGRWVIGPTQFFDMDAIDPGTSGIAHGVDAVMACASADESRIALMAGDGSVTVIDPDDAVRRPIRVAAYDRPATRGVTTLRLSPDGRWLLLGSDAGCELHDLGDESTIDTPLVVPGSASTAVFSQDGGQLAMQATQTATNAIVHVWRLEGGRGEGLSAPIALAGSIDHRPLAFAPNGQSLVTRDGGEDSQVRLWNLAAPDDGDEIFAVVPGKTTAIFLPRGDRLVLTEHRGEIKGWRLFSQANTGDWTLEHVVEIATPEDSFSVTCSDTWLVASLTKAEIYAWDISERGRPRSDLPDRTLRGHDYQATQLAFSNDGHRLVSLGPVSTQIWDFSVPHPEVINQTLAPRPGTLLARPDAPAGGATGERVMSPDGHWLAIDGEDSIIRLLDLTGDDPMRHPIELIGHAGTVVFHTFSRDSRWLATGAADHTICVWDLEQMPRASVAERPVAKPAVRFHAEGLDPACLRFGAEPGHLWSAGATPQGGAMVLWEWSPARPDAAIRRAKIDGIAVRPRVAFTLTPDALTVLREDGTVDRHALGKGVPVGSPERLEDGAAAITPPSAWTGRGTGPYARSPDGRWRTAVADDFGVVLVSIDDDGREAPTRLPRAGQQDALFQCATFSGDSRVLATGFSDGGLQIWDLSADNIARSGLVLRGHTKPVQYIEFDRFDRWLVSSSTHSIRLWENDLAKLITLARKATGRQLTADERTLFGIDEQWHGLPATATSTGR